MTINVTVYRFEYIDRATRMAKVADDYATEAAIGMMGARILRDTAREVPRGEVTVSGLWRPDRSRT